MSIYSGPKPISSGLVFSLDSSNTKRSVTGSNNILDLSIWTVGTGTISGWSNNGAADENQRVLDTGPHSVSSLVWESPQNDIASDGDGGWNSPRFDVDPTKMYRYSVWIRKKDLVGDGTVYLGPRAFNASQTDIGVIIKSNGNNNTNHYFIVIRFDTTLSSLVSVDEWVLFVGHVWPVGTPSGGTSSPDSGIWNTSGTRIHHSTNIDAIWNEGTTRAYHRSYQYYSTTTTEKQQWYHPRVDICDGTEPSIQDLINGAGSKWIDVKNSHEVFISNTPGLLLSTEHGGILFDGIDDESHPSISHSYLESNTLMVVFKSFDHSTRKTIFGYRSNNNFSWPTIGGLYIDGGKLWGSLLTASEVYRRISTPDNIETNTTYHVCLTRNMTTGVMELFVNGEFINDITFDTETFGQWASPGTYIGADILDIGKSTNNNTEQGWGDDYFDGVFYSLKVYNRALSHDEIKEEFESNRKKY